MIRLALFCILLAPMAQAGEISLAALSDLPPADVVFLGEIHDNPLHHKGQARAVAAIHPPAVVFEMLSPTQAARITPALLRDRDALQQALGWNASGWPDFAIYYPVFQALGGARVYGAARPRAAVRRAFEEGAAAVFGPGAGRLGLDRPLPSAELAAREDEQFQDHCEAMPRDLMGGMVEAQRLRDADLAQAALTALSETGGPVVVITGKGHARRDWGAPALLRVAAPERRLLTVGFLEHAPEAPPPFDFWVVTDPTLREDPCKAFAKPAAGASGSG